MTTTKKEKMNLWLTMHLTHISFVQKIFFLEHLRTMIHASISIVEALDILSKEMANKKFRYVTTKIKQEVEQGRGLADVLGSYPEIFPSIYVKMIASGEISGTLDKSLEHIVTQMKKTDALTSSIRGAMIYPAVIILAMVGIGIMMATVVLPKLVQIFDEFNATLPLATRVLIAIVHFVSVPWHVAVIIAGTCFVLFGFVTLLKKSPQFRHTIHRTNLALPIFGSVIKEINLARFSLTLSSLLKSTIPIIDAVDITADTCTNMIYQEKLHSAANQIKTGDALSDVLRKAPGIFPPMVTEMIMVGERSGQVDELLNELADFYGTEVDRTMKNFTAIIEPLIIILLGVAVAGLAVAIIMPMYSLVQNF